MATDVLNLRAGPGVAYDIIGRLDKGDALLARGRSDDAQWLGVTAPSGEMGWAAAWLLSCGFPVEQLNRLSAPPSSTPTEAPALPSATPAQVSAPSLLASAFHPVGPAQPDPSHPCPGCPLAPVYIHGQVLDASGSPLAGVRLMCSNEWHRYPVVTSKGDGWYDFAVIQATTVWQVTVVDENDQPISPVAHVDFDLSVACWYRLDWQAGG